MAGIYIHIPYCKHKCNYCNFYSLASVKYRDELLPAMVREMELQRDYPEGESISTIYFGGGTPSILTSKEIDFLFSGIYKNFNIDGDAEITLEANPDDLRAAKLHELKKAGINRLSIGVQSFLDEDLKFLEREHTGNQARNCIRRAQDAGFRNLSIDLIYGIPSLDSTGWESNLLDAIDSGVPHISAYALTVEEKTPMALRIKQGKMPDIDDEKQLKHFNLLISLLNAYSYEHYEISNFCLPGLYSKHNTGYWQGKKYLGIGPSAHSYNGSSRQWNVAGLGQYVQSLQKGEIPCEHEMLTRSQRYNEYIMTSLRTMWGCDLEVIEENFGTEWMQQALSDAQKYIREGYLIRKNNVLLLTSKGLFHADGIASEFFRVD